MEAHFGAHLFQGPRLEVASPHPVLDRAEDVFDRSSSDTHGIWQAIKPGLHGLDHVLMLPTFDAPFLAGGTARFDLTAVAAIGPVGVEHQALFDRREAPRQPFASRAPVGVGQRIVLEVPLAPTPIRLGARREWLRADGGDARRLAGEYLST